MKLPGSARSPLTRARMVLSSGNENVVLSIYVDDVRLLGVQPTVLSRALARNV